MKIIGIIAEYNPFHQGHQYHIEETRRITGADFIIAVMSGDFVQRGEPAVFDKYSRTEMALRGGADLVIELPSLAACGSAEDFAACGVSLLDHMGCVDGICFGSESGDTSALLPIARLLSDEPEAYRLQLKEYLRTGETFPKARELALSDYINSLSSSACDFRNPPVLSHLSEPNNILGIEYLKSLIKRGSSLSAYTVRRKGQGYNDKSKTSPDVFPSASALRSALKAGRHPSTVFPTAAPTVTPTDPAAVSPDDLTTAFPNDLTTAFHYDLTPVFPDDLSQILNWELLRMTESDTNLTCYADLSEDIAARLIRRRLDFTTFSGRIDQLKTRQYTYTRISRALTHLLLGITEGDMQMLRQMDHAPYARILGFRKSSSQLLSELKKQCDLPLITKTADAEKILSTEAFRIFRKDLYASHLYQSVLADKKGTCTPNEYTRSVIII